MKYAIITALLMSAAVASAQRYETRMQGCVGDGKIDLRWAPADYDTWQAGIKKGYIIERYTIMRGGEILSPDDIAKEHKVLGGAFTPAPLEDWEPYSEEKYAAIAAECIYGEDENVGVLSPKAAYQIHQRQQQKFSFALYAADMSVNVAWLSGLSYTDKAISKDEKYLYKVYVNDTTAQDTAMVFLNASTPTSIQRIPKPTVKWGNKTADISVDLGILSGAYTSYFIERSADGGKSFERLSEAPTVNIAQTGAKNTALSRRDTLPDNSTKFTYRVYGTDCFGRKSEPSVADEGHGVMPLTIAPYITHCETVDNNRIEIGWAFPDSLNNSAEGFRVYRQSGPKSRLKKIFEGCDPQQRSFVDRMPGITNYYKVSVYNAERENLMPTVSYAALVDSFPPIAPVALEGEIDTTGIATIRWKANNESDLAGYRVYTANTIDDKEYSLLTTTMLTDTVFRHKVNLNTLTHEIFYQVRAIDKRDNHSAPSKILVLMRPDTIAPVAPVMKPIEQKRGRPSLQWVCSSSDDIARHYLLRKEPRAEQYDTIAVFADAQNTYDDKTSASGIDYIYAIVAQDRSGNSSRLSSAYYHTDEVAAEKVKIKSRIDNDGNHVSWTVDSNRGIAEYILFRAVNDDNLRIVARTTERTYLDADAKVNNRYTYAIKIVYADGTESGMYK